MIVASNHSAASAGPLALLIIGLLLVITFLLIRNMSGRLRRLPREFPDDPRDAAKAKQDETP